MGLFDGIKLTQDHLSQLNQIMREHDERSALIENIASLVPSPLGIMQFRQVCFDVCSNYPVTGKITLTQLFQDLTFRRSTRLVQNFYGKLAAAEAMQRGE